MRALLLILALAAIALPAYAGDIYYGNTSHGSNNGTSCANAFAYNDVTNGWNVSGQQAAGNTFHVCEPIIGGAGFVAITFINSGSSGNPITLLFETGGAIQAPYCSGSTGCIVMSGVNWITINGGPVCGYVNRTFVACNGSVGSTANGSSLANQQNMNGIYMHNCSNCEVKNIEVGPIYVHTINTDPAGSIAASTIHITNSVGVTGLHIHHVYAHDANSGLDYVAASSGDATAELDHIYFNNENGHISPAEGGATNNLQGLFIHDSYFGDHQIWQTSSDGSSCTFHADDIHGFAQSGGQLFGLNIYNNDFLGNMGACPSSQLFLESNTSGDGGNHKVYNNLFKPSAYLQMSNGIVNLNGNILMFDNNTIIGLSVAGDHCLQFGGRSLTGTLTEAYNNNVTGCAGNLFVENSSYTLGTIDYNNWGNNPSSTPWVINCSSGCTTLNFAGWQAQGFDAHGSFGSSSTYLKLNSDGTLQAGSPAIGSGLNLTSEGITALDSDIRGLARPSSGAWDTGAFNGASIIPSAVYFGNAKIVGGVTIP